MTDVSSNPASARILVTGAGTGFGRGVAIALATRGHHVTAGTLTEAEAASLADEVPGLSAQKLDITDEADRARIAAMEIEVLVNNAGVGQAGPLRSIPMDLMRRVFEVNVFGTLSLTQAVLPGMIGRGRGRVLIVSSVAGVLAGPMTGPYSMTKHALQAMGGALRAELAPFGVDVALVNPGPFATGFNDRMIADSTSWFDRATAAPHEIELLDQARARITGAQLDPAEAISFICDLVEADSTDLVNFVPPDIIERIRGH